MQLSTTVFQTIFIVIYFAARKIIHAYKKIVLLSVCLTLLQSETLGNIQLTWSTLLQVRITRVQQQCELQPGWLLLPTVPSPFGKEGQRGVFCRSPSSLKVWVGQIPSAQPLSPGALQCSWETLVRPNKLKENFSRLLSVNQNCEVTEFHSYSDKNTYYKRQLSRSQKLEVYLQASCMNYKITLSLSEPMPLDIDTSK